MSVIHSTPVSGLNLTGLTVSTGLQKKYTHLFSNWTAEKVVIVSPLPKLGKKSFPWELNTVEMGS